MDQPLTPPAASAFADRFRCAPRMLTNAFYTAAALIMADVNTNVHAAAPGSLEFNRDIRPILSDKCFSCHGPDSGHRKAGLRLDRREDAIKPAKSGETPIKPSDPAGSHILERILSKESDEVMPPPEAKLPALTKAEVELLKSWIAAGAEYQPLWSFIPPKPVVLPEDTANARIPTHNGIDRLVAARLARLKIKPRPEARPETLLRRASLDITGLPPSPAEVREFLSDPAPDAYERAVDRLLASPAFGERMASDWLDISRYADSYGFQVDRDREVWPWRDWVVSAFNRNLPFDQFVTWQLAGDLLPAPTEEQILATAFNRLHQQESEGGSVEEEYRVEYISDRVQTFGTAFLGLTFECAKCHDHKFDPITQKDFYRLFAFFDDIDEAGLYSFFSAGDAPTPAMKLLSNEAKKSLSTLEETERSARSKLKSIAAVQQAAFNEWLENRGLLKTTGEVARIDFEDAKDGRLPNRAAEKFPATLRGENTLVEGVSGKAVKLSGDDALDIPGGNFNRVDPFTISLWIQTPDVKERAVVLHRSKAWTDAASRGFELLIEEGKLKWSLIRFWPGDAASIRCKQPLNPNQWTHVVVSSDGSGSASGLHIRINGEKAALEVIKDSLSRDINPGRESITLGERMRDRGFKDGRVDDVRVFDRELSHLEMLSTFDSSRAAALFSKPTAQLSEVERADLEEYFLKTQAADYAAGLAQLKTARTELVKLLDAQKEIMVMRELPSPKKAFVLFRGQYDQRRDEVFADTPESLPAFPREKPRNRLGLANWLTDPQHPLLARVTVNRIWQGFFGRGIVKTSEDFGSQGAQPEYQEVLDWLSRHFIDSGWDIKTLVRTIVLSRTYRQDSSADPSLIANDPENALLARGPRFRLPAETIRDTFLSASGILSKKLGGPPVSPYEVSEAFRPSAADSGDGALRRSLYTRWRRTSPPPAMMAFDASRRAVCAAKRERTNTPLQALILLNGPQFVEAARILGERLQAGFGPDLQSLTDELFILCLSRLPDAREREIAGLLYAEQLSHFRAHPADAESLLNIGSVPRKAGLPAAETAAATVLAQALLNHDESVVKQ
jgi:hypothetical protein